MLARDPVKTSNVYVKFGALNARTGSSPSSTASSSGVRAGSPTGSGDDKKKKKKKKKKASAGASGANNENDFSDSDSKDVGGNSNETAKDADTSQLPLSRRLEIAASHADIHAALVGLLGWSRLVVNSDAILTFFQCRALELLLENIISSRPSAELIYDNLTALIANCLYVERDGKASTSNKEVATAVVASVRAMVNTLNGDQDEVISIAKVAKYLSKLVIQYRMSLNGVKLESSISQDVIIIETQLASAATKDSAVKGQTIRDSFQRRDIRSDALSLYETRLSKITQLVTENISSSTHSIRAGIADSPGDGGFLAFALQGAEVSLHIDPKEMEEITNRLNNMTQQKATKLTPLEVQKQATAAVLQNLKTKREELENQLRAINTEIQEALEAQQLLDDQVAEVEAEFKAETERFDHEHQRIISLHQQKQRRDQVNEEFAILESVITKISLAHSEVPSLKDKQVICLRQQLEGTLRYFGSELPCAKFMIGRVDESEAQMQKLVEEAKGYEALGVTAVAKELTAKAEAIQIHLDEDKRCIAALLKRDSEVLAMVTRVFQDPALKDALSKIDESVKTEVQRHVEYVTNLVEPSATHGTTTSKSAPPGFDKMA